MRRVMRAAVVVGAAALLLSLVMPASAQPPKTDQVTQATVTIRGDQPTATLGRDTIGVNTPIWNPNLVHKAVPRLIRDAGLRTLVFNGGGVSDLYHWADGSLSQDPDKAHHPYDYFALKPRFSFDQFQTMARLSDASTLVHVNYGTGTAAEAAAWVRHANRNNNDRVRDWEIGEEVYLNGYFPDLNIEPDAHADKSPAAYARNVVDYTKAMKAADPGIRVGVGLLVAGPGPSQFRDWNETVLRIAGPAIDFVDLHWYPSAFVGNDRAKLLGSADNIPTLMADMRATIDRLAGPPSRVAIIIGETNSAVTGGPDQIAPFNALFLADHTLTMLDHTAQSVDVWALHNGWEGSGDLGLLATGNCEARRCSPPADTPYPSYHGVQLATLVAGHGGELLSTSSDNGLVRAHASQRADGSTAVLLANADPAQAKRVRLDLAGCQPGSQVEVWSYQPGNTGPQVRRERGTATAVRTLAPYSITVLVVRPDR